jgi:4-hydroxybenzoate polyprenyltransferase
MLSFPYSLAIFYLVLIGSLSALIYSARPLRLKSFLFTNIFLNSFGFSLLFMIGFVSASKNITFSCLLMTALFAIIFIPLQIIHNLSHAEMEQRTNLKTTPDLYKLKTMLYFFNIALVLILLWLLIMVLFLENKYILLFLPTAPFVLSLFYLMRKLNMADTSTAIKARVLLRKICILYGLALLFILPLLG